MSDEKDDDIPALEPSDALKLILEICEPISTGDLDDPVERVCRIAEKSLEVPSERISKEKRDLANKLYAQAIYFRRVVLEMLDGLTQMSLKRVQEEGDRLDKIMSDINDGKLPYRFESKVENICATAALLSKDVV
jgi:hypothetical protein